VEFFDQAIAAAARAGDAPEVLRLGLDLRIRQRDALFRLGRTRQVRTRLEEAEKLAARENVADDPRRAQVALLQAHINWLTGRYRHASTAIDRAEAIQAVLADQLLALRIRYERAAIAKALGDVAKAAEEMTAVADAILAERPAAGRFGIDLSLGATAACYAARSFADLGLAEDAARAAELSERCAALWGRPFAHIFSTLARGAACLSQDRPSEAISCFTQALALTDAADARLMLPPVLMLLGLGHLRARSAEALSVLRRAVDVAEEIGFCFQQPLRLALMAQALAANGDRDAAGDAMRKATRMARRQSDLPVLARLSVRVA
jgi:tetratricopeptide (TPR) repeat protein